jgi:hypothetical protein
MKLSYVIVTHNRRAALMATLRHLHATTPLPPEAWEAWVVDNASTDGSVEAVRCEFPGVKIIERDDNEGTAARSHAFGPARGRYLILLDDDSYPIGDTVSRSIEYMDRHPRTAALVGKVVLPDGLLEACAMPSVMLSGAVCIRKSVLDEVGGFHAEFFRKAGEYDLSFRMMQAGYLVERFEDIVYRHDKVMTGRCSELAHRMDLRNNLILVERYLPREMRRAYRRDWLKRYAAIAIAAGCRTAASQAIHEARLWAQRERLAGRQTLSAGVLEMIFEHDKQQREVAAWAAMNRIGRIVIADYAKTLYATFRAAKLAGLEVAAIADNGKAFEGMSYRGVEIVPDERALGRGVDGVIIANINPAQIDRRVEQVRKHFAGPVLRLWQPRVLTTPVAEAG